jgi:hypothetical protein
MRNPRWYAARTVADTSTRCAALLEESRLPLDEGSLRIALISEGERPSAGEEMAFRMQELLCIYE